MKFLKILKNNKGFTLIEALLTVLIIGLVVAPITSIFVGSMNKARENEEILVANQTSQLFIEYMKSKSYEELMTDAFASSNTITVDPAVHTNLPAIPSGYSVELSIREGTGVLNKPEYIKPALISVEADADITLYLYTALDDPLNPVFGNTFYVEDSAGVKTQFQQFNNPEIKIVYYHDSAAGNEKISVEMLDSAGNTISGSRKIFASPQGTTHGVGKVNIISNATNTGTRSTGEVVSLATPLQPKIEIHNNHTIPNSLVVNQYQIADGTIQTSYSEHGPLSGSIEVRGTKMYVEDTSGAFFVYEIGVKVSKNSKVLTEVSATRRQR